MSISITGQVATPPLAAESGSTKLTVAKSSPKATNNTADTVKLSEAQQVYQLSNQGQAVSQIASNLGLTIDTVNSYLGIPTAI